MVHLLDLPVQLHVAGLIVPTYVPLMGLFLGINLVLTLTGGLITIMMTNCVEGIVSQLLYIVLIFGLLSMFHWSDISATLGHQPPHQSLLNPMDSSGLKDFNLGYVIMMLLINIYGTMAWQNQSAYQSAPLTAHEGRMGGILGQWREKAKYALITLLALCAITYLHHPHYAAQAAVVHEQLGKITNPQIQEQMELPVAIIHLLPPGPARRAVRHPAARHLRRRFHAPAFLGQHLHPGRDPPVSQPGLHARAAHPAASLLDHRRGALRLRFRLAVPAKRIHPDVVERDDEHLCRGRRRGHHRRPLLETRGRRRARGPGC